MHKVLSKTRCSDFVVEREETPEVYSVFVAPMVGRAASFRVDYRGDLIALYIGAVSSPIEISVPININYGKPYQGWEQDLTAVLTAVVMGGIQIGETDDREPVAVIIDGSRLAVSHVGGEEVRWRRPDPWC